MSRLRSSLILLAAVSCACRGVSIRPESADASTIAAVELTADEQRVLAETVDRAVDAVVRRRYAEAEVAANEALALDPRSARARATIGMVLFQKSAASDPPDLFLANAGEREILLAMEIAPNDAFAGWIHAVFLALSGHMSAAAQAAEDALVRAEKAPATERAALLGIAGTYRYELAEERAALPHLQAYVALRPDDSAACFRVGSCLLRKSAVPQGAKADALLAAQRDAENAAAAFARCCELAPGDEDGALAVGAAWKRAADLAHQRGDAAAHEKCSSEAEKVCRAAAERFPSSAEAMFRVGVLAEERKTFPAAAAAYAQALVRNGDHLGSLLNLAALSESGALVGAPAARELWSRALAVDARRGGLSADERRRLEARVRGS